ncbi:ATP-binding protein [Polaromonas eurypsychrophila]|uniref:histidine kinase n=1 Tax=Polaromonas eurypsychrophila TaxID=1614635 RepID=A0A916WJP2_9BURK|nr:ATP-binding protein [Polaromonas eurypsychrophila]GGB03894.1 two-component sensor histidine kinase [Polaromonas eurypsychrophila]
MKGGISIRVRLLLGAALVLLAFLTGAGLAVQRANAESVQAAYFGRLQSTIYLLLAAAELDASGALVMPQAFAEPRLSLPGSGLYAGIYNVLRGDRWQSASALGQQLPFRRSLQAGQWRNETLDEAGGSFLSVSYAVTWKASAREAPLVLTVLEDRAAFNREVGAFTRTLWLWLGAASVLLLLAQLWLLRWGLAPLRRVASEIRRIEEGEQSRIEGRYPAEISGLTDNLNTLIQQERVRQTRHRDALSFLAHSLKTPLAVLRSALAEPAHLPATVAQQVSRMDDIVQHQLGRAIAGGAARFAPPLLLAPVVERIRDALAKVYAEKALDFSVECPPDLAWRIDEGDLFEMLGNLLDNAAKWARSRVGVRVWRDAGRLCICIEDDGPGFTDTESVLRLHVRGDERVPGHGVGLAVVSDLVASHQGELKLVRSLMGGARVDIVLPVP